MIKAEIKKIMTLGDQKEKVSERMKEKSHNL